MREVRRLGIRAAFAGGILGTAIFAGGCDYEEGAPGARGLCGEVSGQPLCEDMRIESAEDACSKLVACASIPVSPPDGVDNPQTYFTYSTCVETLQRYPDHRQFIALACVEASTCDQLRFRNGPEAPRTGASGLPPCLEYGDQ